MALVILLLAAILITLLGAWPLVGVVLGLILAVVLLVLCFRLSVAGVKAVLGFGRQALFEWEVNLLYLLHPKKKRERQIIQRIAKRRELGYSTEELEQELEMIRKR